MFGRMVLENFADIPLEEKDFIIKDFTQHPPCLVSSNIEIDDFRSQVHREGVNQQKDCDIRNFFDAFPQKIVWVKKNLSMPSAGMNIHYNALH